MYDAGWHDSWDLSLKSKPELPTKRLTHRCDQQRLRASKERCVCWRDSPLACRRTNYALFMCLKILDFIQEGRLLDSFTKKLQITDGMDFSLLLTFSYFYLIACETARTSTSLQSNPKFQLGIFELSGIDCMQPVHAAFHNLNFTLRNKRINSIQMLQCTRPQQLLQFYAQSYLCCMLIAWDFFITAWNDHNIGTDTRGKNALVCGKRR